MMTPLELDVTPSCNPCDHTGDYTFFCKLFDDMVSRGLCLLRRRTLNGNGFSCSGCSKDTIMGTRAAALCAGGRR